MMRDDYLDGSEGSGGYCRAVRRGNQIFISGTGGLKDGSLVGPDVTSQTQRIYERFEQSLKHFGAAKTDIVRVCAYVTDLATADEFMKVHEAFFLPAGPLPLSLKFDLVLGIASSRSTPRPSSPDGPAGPSDRKNKPALRE
ncbi:MAG: RidA family protein [Sphingomonadales bacterium]|nr:RidA family protein [Sphingomonadales bacterium]